MNVSGHESTTAALQRPSSVIHRYASFVVKFPFLFSLVLSVSTLSLIAISISKTPSGYLDFSDPMVGFSPKGTDLNGRILAKKRVVWPDDLMLADDMFFDSPGEAAWQRSQHPEWGRRLHKSSNNISVSYHPSTDSRALGLTDDNIVMGPFQSNWWDANEFCKKRGRTLVSIKSASDNNVVSEIVKGINMCIWLGGSDINEEGIFQWVGDPDFPLDSFKNFLPGEPNNWAGDEDCIQMCPGGGWNDISCGATMPFVCGPSDGTVPTVDDDDFGIEDNSGPYDTFVCPTLLKGGDEHISLLFGYVDSSGTMLSVDDFSGGSIVSGPGLRAICELDAAVRDFTPGGKPHGAFWPSDFRNTCEMSPIDSWRHCCASRSVFLSYEVMLKSDLVEASKFPGTETSTADEPYWNPFEELMFYSDVDKSPFATNALCGSVATPDASDGDYEAAAKYLNDMFMTCAPHYASNTLAACAIAEDYISMNQNNLEGENAILAFGQLLKCEIEVPHECLVGAGSGALDSFLSLLPEQYAGHLAVNGGGVDIHVLRTMLPIRGSKGEYYDYKTELLKYLDRKYFYKTGVPLHGIKGKPGVALIGYSAGIKRDLFSEAIVRDIAKAGGAMFCVFVLMWWYTRSLGVTVLSFLEILSSLGVGYFIFLVVLRMKFFPFMNVVTIFLAIGIGADDVFVYIDCWRLSLVEVPFEHVDSDPPPPPPSPPRSLFHPLRYLSLPPKLTPSQQRHQTLRLEYCLRHAGASTFHTSFTTSAAFLTNCTSNIVSVRCFGLYAALVVISDYILMITFLPAIVCIFDRTVCGEERFERQQRHHTLTNTRYPTPKSPGAPPQATPPDFSCHQYLSPQMSDVARAVLGGVKRVLFILESLSVRLFTEFIPLMLLGPPSIGVNSESSKKKSLLSMFMERLSSLWICVLGVLGFSCILISLWLPGLTLPPYSGYQLFRDDNPMEVLEIKYMDTFASSSVEGRKWEIEFYFGIGRKDNSDFWDPLSPGSNQMVPLRVGTSEAQQFFSDFYDELVSSEWYGNVEDWMPFFMPRFKEFVFTPCSPDTLIEGSQCCGFSNATFPLEEDVFDKCIVVWCEQNGRGKSDQGLFFDRDGKLAVIQLVVPTNINYSLNKAESQKFWDMLQGIEKKWINENRALRGTGLSEGWAWTQLQVYDVQVEIEKGVTQSLLLSLLIAIVTVYCTTASLAITCASAITISCILGCTISVLINLGWYLSIGESIVFSLAVGLSVDFCVHYGWAVIMTLSHEKDEEPADVSEFKRRLVVASLTEMGSSVAMGASTTVFAGLVMATCETLFFVRLGTFLVTVMGFSWLFSTFFFQALVAVMPVSILKLKLRGIPQLLNRAYLAVSGRGNAVASSSAAAGNPAFSFASAIGKKTGYADVRRRVREDAEELDETIQFDEGDRPFPPEGIQMQSTSTTKAML